MSALTPEQEARVREIVRYRRDYVQVPAPLAWAGAIALALLASGCAIFSFWLAQPVCNPSETPGTSNASTTGRSCREDFDALIGSAPKEQAEARGHSENHDRGQGGGARPIHAVSEDGPLAVALPRFIAEPNEGAPEERGERGPKFHPATLTTALAESMA